MSDFNWTVTTASGMEEDEVSEEPSTDEDDYSPHSLIIDAAVEKGSPSTASAPPTPPIEMLQHSLMQFDTIPIFTTITAPSPTLPTYTPSHSQSQHSSSFLTTQAPPLPLMVSSDFNPTSQSSAELHQISSSLPSFLGTVDGEGFVTEKVKFVTKIEVATTEGSPAVDTLCIYKFLYGEEYIEILTRKDRTPLIPIKNVYLKAIPGLKQNVLSARISKLGIRSLVLSEPYVSTVKKLSLGLNGSSHYITVSDFLKICTYFKRPIPDFIHKFDFITSNLLPKNVLKLFNDPDAVASKDLLSQLSEEAVKRDIGLDDIPGIGGGALIRGSGSPSRRSDGTNPDGSINFSDVDARRLTLPNGSSIFLLVKEGVVYLPNPELAKILPAVSRTAMEHIRNSYGITVTQATKTDMGVLKYLGVVSMKAGRTLLYKVSDVATMFNHWKSTIPEFVKDMVQGKIPEEKVFIDPTASTFQGVFMMSEGHSRTPSPHAHMATSTPPSASNLLSSQVAPDHTHSQLAQGHYGQDSRNLSSAKVSSLSNSSSLYESSSSQPTIKGVEQRGAFTSPICEGGNLTPDQFQLPVQMLNTLSGEGTLSSSGHVTNESSPVNNDSSPVATDSVRGKPRRRSSSVTGSPLDDQDLEYSYILWGEERLTLLCPVGEEPYLAVPELIQKVFHYRTYFSAHERNRLGVVLLPASSVQTHALRARNSLDNLAGNVKLVSLSDAVRLAMSGNIQIPGSVIQKLSAYSKIPLQQILNPVPVSDTKNHKQEMVSSEGGVKGERSIVVVPSHPDIIPAAPDWRLDGVMCQVKWGNSNLVVYMTNSGTNCMGLYQVYEVLFKCYVTRMNFKMRMRKLDIRSNRAPSSVRLKLVELGALPTHCPVCGLITVREMERLAKSYGIEPPQVFYDHFLAGKSEQQLIVGRRPPNPIPTRIPKLLNPVPLEVIHTPPTSQLTHFPQNLFSYQFDPTEDSTPSSQVQHTPPSSNVSLVSHPSPPSQVPHPALTSHVQQYGIVPYLTSSREQISDQSDSSTPNLIMTSLGTKSTNQIHVLEATEPLVVSISREMTPFKVIPISATSMMEFNDPLQLSNTKMPNSPYNGPRGRVLQSLAKKISQKSRKFNSLRATNQNQRCSGPLDLSGGTRNCPSCGRANPQHKKRCSYCDQFIVGTPCPSCLVLNYYRAKTCMKCGGVMPYAWTSVGKDVPSTKSHDKGVVPGGGASVGSSHPSSPISPKFSAPPIRNAVLKSLFPQQKSGETNSKIGNGSSQQPKTPFSGNLSRKCVECGEMNSRMAKKCTRCYAHLQGRPCTMCGRPNLNHVTECYKCGAKLPPSKWLYMGSRNNKTYKNNSVTAKTIERKVILSRAPIVCIRCHKIRSSGFFKCGRCGDPFKAHPLVSPPWEKKADDKVFPPPPKRRKGSTENSSTEGEKEETKLDPMIFHGFACNLLSLGLQEQLTPLILGAQHESKEKIGAAEEEYNAVSDEYENILSKKMTAEQNFNDARAELDGMLSQIEGTNNILEGVIDKEEAAKKEIESLPTQIEELKNKIGASKSLIFKNES